LIQWHKNKLFELNSQVLAVGLKYTNAKEM
jgi:hypothetical protein